MGDEDMKRLLAVLGFLFMGCSSHPTRTDIVLRNRLDRDVKVKIIGAYMTRTVEIQRNSIWLGWLDRAWIGSNMEVIIE